MKKWVAWILSCAMCFCAVPAVSSSAGSATEPVRILAIGNSYSNNATQFTEFIAETLNEDLNIEVYSLYYAGCSLAQHVDYYTNNKQVYELYRKGTNVNGTDVLITMKDAFDLYDYDYVTIQQAPGRASEYDTFWTEAKPYLTQLQSFIQQNEPQAKIKIHQTWSFNNYCAIGNDPYYNRSFENSKAMFADIEDAYEKAAAKLGLTNADIIPVGRAVQLAKDQFGYGDFYNPTGETRYANGALYDDNISHLNVRGRYLAACVWLEYFFGVDCRKATYVQANLTEADCAVLREIAHETVTGMASTVVGDWRVLDNGAGVKIMHYMGAVPENGTVTIPATVGGKSVNAIAGTIFKYVEGLERLAVPEDALTEWDIEEGAFPVALTDVGVGTVVGNGTLTFSAGNETNVASLTEVEAGTIVTVTATPAQGYLLVPGSVTYVTASGKTVSILNKTLDNSGFGQGSGYTYQFQMPEEQIVVNATFADTTDDSFSFDTIGTSVHKTDNIYNGIRFLTRINFGTLQTDDGAVTVMYKGETYTVTKIGMLLKRAESATEMSLENSEIYTNGIDKVWNAVAYDSSVSDVVSVVDYTESYIDVQVAMLKNEITTYTTFKSRKFSACGYMVLTDAQGNDKVVYTESTITKCIKDIVPSKPLAPEFGEVELT